MQVTVVDAPRSGREAGCVGAGRRRPPQQPDMRLRQGRRGWQGFRYCPAGRAYVGYMELDSHKVATTGPFECKEELTTLPQQLRSA